jgi:hypothetical protein
MTDKLTIAKVSIVVLILILTFINLSKQLSFIDNKAVKIVLLIGVLGALYYDLHTGILLTVVFLMIMIQLNAVSIHNIQQKKLEMFLASIPADFDKNEKESDLGVEMKKSYECGNEKKDKLSEDIFDYSVDNKVKPYEVFVRMMTTKQQLDDASNAAFLQPEPSDLL